MDRPGGEPVCPSFVERAGTGKRHERRIEGGGASIDDYLETIYFLAFPIGEYRPDTKGASTLAVRVADIITVGPGSLYTSILPNLLVARGRVRARCIALMFTSASPSMIIREASPMA